MMQLLSTPFHKYGDVFGVRKLACALFWRCLLPQMGLKYVSVFMNQSTKLAFEPLAGAVIVGSG